MTHDWPGLILTAQQAGARGDAAGVVSILTVPCADPAAPLPALRLVAGALRALSRNAQARPILQRIADQQPTSAVAWHNLAAALGDMGDAPAAEAAARQALARGGDAPETWLVLGRALVCLSRLDEAEAALRRATAHRPDYPEALRDLAQLVWMRGGRARDALSPLDSLLASPGASPDQAALRASIAREIAGPQEAFEGLRPWLDTRPSLAVLLVANAAASEFDPSLALHLATQAVALAPDDPRAEIALSTARIATGQADQALPALDRLIARFPLDQTAIALRFTAWRVVGDPRALTAADYGRLVRAYDLVPPPGIDAGPWMARAGQALRRLHPFVAQPLGQSIRSGVQAALDPRFAADPDIDAIFAALRVPIATYIAEMEGQTDPMSLRAGSGHEIIGAWSVRLTAGGHHSDHVHPQGWVSSALYIETPAPSADAPHAGWLRFGAVRLGAGLTLPAQYRIEPRPGRVVLFPSWMWHGTEPFTGTGERLTIAFDAQPR